jgi:hypothetical protein
MASALTDRDRDDEPRDVFRWRFRELREAGYSIGGAMRLAETEDVDLHRAIRILERGCSEPVALEILL